MLTDTKKMLDKARDGGYAVGAFNAENAEMVFAIVAAAQKCKAPVILQTTPSTLRYLPAGLFRGDCCCRCQKCCGTGSAASGPRGQPGAGERMPGRGLHFGHVRRVPAAFCGERRPDRPGGTDGESLRRQL